MQFLIIFDQNSANHVKEITEAGAVRDVQNGADDLYKPGDELYLLSKKLYWESPEREFEPLYGTVGRPSVPIRTIVGLLLLKQMYNLDDETMVQRYLENPYWPHFA